MSMAKSDSRRAETPPPPPEPLAVPVPDSHTHLDIVGGDPAADIEAARKVGIDRLVQVGVDLDSSRWAAELAAAQPAVLAAVALHPNEAPRLADLDSELRAIEDLAGQSRVRGIGETGLDYFRTGEDGRAAQEHSFRAHIAIAKRFGKALVIHDRDAHADVLRVLDEEGSPDTVVLHCFSGDRAFATECVRRGYVLSFAGTVTFKNAANLRDAALVTPPDQMMVETDAPYLTPMPYRGRPNAPYLVPLTVRSLAETTGRDLDELCAAISTTTERVFGGWAPGK
ncbi:TatD family hydrolase [Rugosimonospora africana]|uniref:AraC family transcriptional regulator n=1 Tax=Rugosimonospora africana TaxID=556532 RepID=A0A8J3VMU0_9ACTN|nr:TatD family hydrolase [Rugosimonospora africana]GIH12579.1 AraC family transcriptional regulator [Rugosimonospora africana]